MNIKTQILTLCLFALALTNSLSQNGERTKNMNLIPEGELIDDSTGQTIVFKAFWLSNQITNKEFRAFWEYANNNPNNELEWAELLHRTLNDSKTKPTIKRVKYAEITKETIDKKNWPSTDYFESTQYDNMPAIGVSTILANYYCIWKAYETQKRLQEVGQELSSSYYLATPLQCKYAQKKQPARFTKDDSGFRVVLDE
jgi:hypothetical protein